ncbi:hypothetical protein OIU79_010072 [Salix purpurea]|uniref:Uncharacterized protein n=1 Tax=Salix purpurea TaxID=77065 RepID=A0A9Q0QFC6_SALPP|nr:hypothetical protein OIU79_010072 [Salix purpurea]
MKNRLYTKLAAGRTSLGATHRKRLERKNNARKLSWSVKRIGAQIVKARAEKDHAKDALLTQTLRDLMRKSNPSEEKQEEEY